MGKVEPREEAGPNWQNWESFLPGRKKLRLDLLYYYLQLSKEKTAKNYKKTGNS